MAKDKAARRALMIARKQQALLRRVANIYQGPRGGMDPSPGGGGYAGPGGGKYIGPSNYAKGGAIPPFKLHSGAAKIIEAKGQAKATPQQYAAMPGIKPDELKYAKFDTLGNKALPKEQVLEHLEGNTVPLQETVYTGNDARSALKRYSGHAPLALPGGANYREVLLKLPAHAEAQEAEKRAQEVHDAYLARQAARQAFLDARDRKGSEGSLDEYRQHEAAIEAHETAIGRHRRAMAKAEKTGFQSSHWPEEPNVVAHLRMHDRRSPNGEKVLHVEEVQSDWGQKAREVGTKGSKTHQIEQAVVPHISDEPVWAARNLANGRHEYPGPTRESVEQELAQAEARQPPSGPYVDNTQKWTDLALKRVLHEAAHGGYDKVVFTPGAEQNKRYSLAKHVTALEHSKNPDGTYRVDAHLPDGDNHLLGDELSEQELSAQVGKEIAQKIVRGEGETHPSLNGKVLRGLDLEVGGSGMRGYYDNILPKRLQTLAQQHDPQAQVQLHSTPVAEADAPLHSLDITPQMRDSIKTNGFSQFKRGGAVDENEGPIADWHWRPLRDVQDELQLHEIPSHVHKFGEFMDETARRASLHGLTPRDLIKAYTITRASIQRRAQDADNLRRSGLILPASVKGMVRPEGAFGHWLHSKHGQRYLDAAEAGRVDDEAVANAQQVMKPFGKADKDLPDALRWAAANLPGQEGRISELIARAHRGASHPDEWRDANAGLKGIGPAKKGFYASMLGRGDQPTLDARQIVLHTGRPTSEAVPYLGKKGAPEAAVGRLSDRQTAMNLRHDKGMSPFYQHLAHHAVWDKAAGEETTHDDVVNALRGAKDGGRQGYKKGGKAEDLGLIGSHPVMRALVEGLPHEAFLPTKHAELTDLLKQAGVVRPYDNNRENVERALKIAQDNYLMQTGVGSGKDPSSYYNIRQPVAARDVSTKIAGLRNRDPKPQVDMSWEKFGKIGKGGTAINLAGDRTRIGTLGAINGKKLNWPVHLYGGPEYIREGQRGTVWANNAGVATGLRNTIRKLSQRGPVYGIYAPMSAVSGDQAHHMFDAVMAQIDPKSIDKRHRKEFDDAMRSGAFIMGNTEQVLKDRARVAEKMKKWPGIDNPKEASKFALANLAGVDRKAIIQYLDKKMWSDRGFPHIGMTRAAITDPSVRDVHDNTIGGHVALLDPDQLDRQPSGNPTYPEGISGQYVGTLPFVQKHYAAPVSTAHLVTTPTAGKGKLSHPFSVDDKARSSYRKLYEQNLIPEPIDQRMVDSASEGMEKQKLYGLKRGGSVVDRALALTRKKTNAR